MPVCPACGERNLARAQFCMSCGQPLPSPGTDAAAEVRKVVTVLFSDIAGSTPIGERLDPEAVRRVMGRFFEEMKRVLERHGGTVEKFIGDAIVAVFGIPVLHEDDAVRAVRAALEMQRTLATLNQELDPLGVSIVTRTGINTGEVVAGDPAWGQPLVVGDAVNVAARLEQSAPPDGVVLGADTYALVREFVRVEPKEDVILKGKRAPVTTYRLLGLNTGSTAQPARAEPALVGRQGELDLLRAAFERTVNERACHLLTVVGSAGVGKSRLAKEFVSSLGGAVTALVGRCLPYGEGITFWPVSEIVKQATGIADEDRRDEARAKIDALLEGSVDAALVADRVAAAATLSDSSVGIQETYWAIRRLCEWLGRERPLVLVFDDIQWGEDAFLGLLEYLVGWGRDVPILLLCLARPDLLDVRPAWTAASAHTSAISLAPLTDGETEQLIVNHLGPEGLDPPIIDRFIEAGGGNPLFVEELLRMLEDEGVLQRDEGRLSVIGDVVEIVVPRTIQALLSARLDRLDPAERTVIRSASVVGKFFWWGAVSELVPERLRPEVGAHLQTLVRKELIRPDRSAFAGFAGEDAFRFHHILIQEAAYQGTPKETRVDLHRRFAAWLERAAGERSAEYEEVLGYHLEQAARNRTELGLEDEETRSLAVRAAELLASAGRRALSRGDMHAAANLLDRAAGQLPADDPIRLRLLPDLGEALMEAGDFARADGVLTEGATLAASAGDPGLEAHARIVRLLLQESTDPKHRAEEAIRVLGETIPVLEELGDHLGLARAWRLLGDLRWTRGRYADAGDALERAVDHARSAGAVWQEVEVLGQFAGAGLYGPTPVPEVVERCRRILERSGRNPSVEARVFRTLGSLRAMEGKFDEARELVRRAREILVDLGLKLRASFASEAAAFVEMLAGDPVAAEGELRAGYEAAESLGERGFQSTVAALLAHALWEQRRLAEAERYSRIAEEIGAEDDLSTQVLWRSARARVLAAAGDEVAAEELARRAVALAEDTDDVNMCADTLVALGEVLRAGGRDDDAATALGDALARYEAKGNVVGADDVRRRLDALDASV